MTILDRAEHLVEEWIGIPRSDWDFAITDLYLRIVEALEQTVEQCARIADLHEQDAQHEFRRTADSADRMKLSGCVQAATQIAQIIRAMP